MPAAASPDAAAVELAYWDSIKDSRTIEDYQAYLSQYPHGSFSNLATARIGTLQSGASVTPPPGQPNVPATNASPADERRAALEQELANREDALKKMK